MTEAERLLKELVKALDNAFISSWQSESWLAEKEAARTYLASKENNPDDAVIQF